MPKRVLLTGGAGLIGSHTIEHILQETDWEIILLCSFKHKGDSERLTNIDPKRVTVHICDLSSPISYRLAEKLGKIDYIINLASDSHVDRSITDPVPFIQNNVNVVLYMLELAKELKPDIFIQASTDEVYGPAPEGTTHPEWDTILPSNPYSASKAAQEAIAVSYWRTYGVPVVITNTMNNFGERQDPEKFIPMTIKKVLNGEEMIIHASKEGKPGSRYYLHARNHADAFLFIINNATPDMYVDGADRPSRFNVVGEMEVDNLTMAQKIAEFVGKPLKFQLVDFHSSRPGHDLRYALDGKKLADLGWKAPVPMWESLQKTVEWGLEHPEWLK